MKPNTDTESIRAMKVIDVKRLSNCARCGKNHRQLKFKKLKRPGLSHRGGAHSHWALCPTTREPIMLTVLEV